MGAYLFVIEWLGDGQETLSILRRDTETIADVAVDQLVIETRVLVAIGRCHRQQRRPRRRVLPDHRLVDFRIENGIVIIQILNLQHHLSRSAFMRIATVNSQNLIKTI